MRDYKFRGQKKRTHEWVYGDFYHAVSHESCIDEWEVVRNTVGQWTDIKDKNGTEIYEEDLTHAAGSRIVFRVVFYLGSFCLVPYHTHSREAIELWERDGNTMIMPLHLMMKRGDLGDLEVVGNIHEGVQKVSKD